MTAEDLTIMKIDPLDPILEDEDNRKLDPTKTSTPDAAPDPIAAPEPLSSLAITITLELAVPIILITAAKIVCGTKTNPNGVGNSPKLGTGS
jgi:hypothetical protein